LPDFSLLNVPKWGRIYHIATKLPNGHKYIPNGRNVFQITIEYIYQLFSFQGRPKVSQIWIFGLNHTIWQPWWGFDLTTDSSNLSWTIPQDHTPCSWFL
jgi:hypothetical protein